MMAKSKAAASEGILRLLQKLNKVDINEALERGCLPFFVNNQQVGLIRPDFWAHFKHYPDVFQLVEKSEGVRKFGVHLTENCKNYEERTVTINNVLEDLKAKDAIGALRGWRDEVRETFFKV
ncbi:low quality protein: thiamine pyrophosphokinase [Plakobranchus ocellatus]|uniref:Low quality protein: thiamine pyrophosphokinase n=1 Tax=Plakobranchus ocellatus TaxID=259542 RepID=A0AAV4DFP5_9GAST|nr:low quality protein: thiamine pyrophosphokinase [Plakobranchus ocellatus]